MKRLEKNHEMREGLSLVMCQNYLSIRVNILLIVHAAHTQQKPGVQSGGRSAKCILGYFLTMTNNETS